MVTEEKSGTLPELMATALGMPKMRIVETGGTPRRHPGYRDCRARTAPHSATASAAMISRDQNG